MNDAFYEAVAVWSQVVASLLFIVVLVYLWNRFVTPNIVGARNRKNAMLAEVEKLRDDARAGVDRARAEVVDAEASAVAIAVRAQTDAQRLHERSLADAKIEGDRLIRNAEGELARGRAAARDELRASLVAKALAIARAASAQLDDKTNTRLVDEAVGAARNSGRP